MRQLGRKLAYWCGIGWGFGLSPIAPGTVGAIWGVPLSWWLYTQLDSVALQLLCGLVVALIGVPICQVAAERIGRKDPGEVVWDEIASMPLVFAMLPRASIERWEVLLCGFVFHRVFDIAKPPPVRLLEKLPGGWGIMADDFAAAAYACAAMHLLLLMLPG